MGAALSWLVALLAVLPSALPTELAPVLDDRSRLALALVPWLFLAGLPRRASWSWGTALGLALPTIALAAWLDLRGSQAANDVALRAAWALCCAVPAWVAAECAAGARLHAAAWFLLWVLVPIATVFASLIEPSGAVGWGAALSPVARALRAATDLRLGAHDAVAFAVALGLLVPAFLGRARPSEGTASE